MILSKQLYQKNLIFKTYVKPCQAHHLKQFSLKFFDVGQSKIPKNTAEQDIQGSKITSTALYALLCMCPDLILNMV